jgi:putative hydrolase of the HAD superfamily
MSAASSPHLSAANARRFEHVETWVFDLDNTLYPHEARVWPQVDERITLYLMGHFEMDGLSARALQKHYYHRYGTTLRGLMEEEGIDAAHFLDFAHDIDHSAIELNPLLGSAIERLPGRKLILTNGSRKQLGIFDHFEDVFDIEAAGFTPKPDRRAYDLFLDKHAVEPARAAMFEDIAKNLVVPHDLGMTTCLVLPKTVDPFRDAFEQEAVEAPHIDHVTTDLAGFLAGPVRGTL